MRKVLLTVLLTGGLLILAFQFSSNPKAVNSVSSSINTIQSSIISPNIDPIEA